MWLDPVGNTPRIVQTKRTPAERLAVQASAIRPTITGNVSR